MAAVLSAFQESGEQGVAELRIGLAIHPRREGIVVGHPGADAGVVADRRQAANAMLREVFVARDPVPHLVIGTGRRRHEQKHAPAQKVLQARNRCRIEEAVPMQMKEQVHPALRRVEIIAGGIFVPASAAGSAVDVQRFFGEPNAMADEAIRVRMAEEGETDGADQIGAVRLEIRIAGVELPVHQVGFHVHMAHEHEELADEPLFIRRETARSGDQIVALRPGSNGARADRRVTVAKVTPQQDHLGSDLSGIKQFRFFSPGGEGIVVDGEEHGFRRPALGVATGDLIPKRGKQRVRLLRAQRAQIFPMSHDKRAVDLVLLVQPPVLVFLQAGRGILVLDGGEFLEGPVIFLHIRDENAPQAFAIEEAEIEIGVAGRIGPRRNHGDG